jgi:hypothetical protein
MDKNMKRVLLAAGVMAITLGAVWAVDEGIRVGPLRLSIWGEISGTYDDNVRLVVPDGEIQDRTIFADEDAGLDEKEEDDIFYEGTLGLRLFRDTDSFLASLSGQYTARRYEDFDDLDNESWVEEAEIQFGDRELNKFSLALRQAYREVFDYEKAAYPDDFTNPDTRGLFLAEDRTERVSRQLLDLAGILTWQISDKLGSDFSVGYGSIEYDTELLYDWTDTKGQVELDYRVTDKTSALLTGQYGVQESDALDNEPDYYVIRGGVLTRTTDKLSFKGGVGAGRYDRFRKSDRDEDLADADVAEEIDQEEDDVIDYLSFDLAGDWDLSQRTKLQIIGRNAVQPAAQYDDNAKLVTVASIGLSHRLFERFRLAATISYRNDDYEDLVEVDEDVFVDQKDTIWGGQLRLDYERPNGYFNVYAEAKYEDRETTIPNEDYDQIRLSIGLRVQI